MREKKNFSQFSMEMHIKAYIQDYDKTMNIR